MNTNVPQQTRNDQINVFYGLINCTWGSYVTAQTLEPSEKSMLQAHKRHLCWCPTTVSFWKVIEPSASNPQQCWSPPEEQDWVLRPSAGTQMRLGGGPQKEVSKGHMALLLLCLTHLSEAPPERASQHPPPPYAVPHQHGAQSTRFKWCSKPQCFRTGPWALCSLRDRKQHDLLQKHTFSCRVSYTSLATNIWLYQISAKYKSKCFSVSLFLQKD